MELAEKVCLITGASGAIGLAIAEHFYTAGADLALTSHSAKPEELTRKLSGGKGRVLWNALNIRNQEEVQLLVKKVEKEFGRIDVLVNCAGVLGPIGPTSNVSTDDWVQTIETNLLGSFYMVRAVLPGMCTRKQGKILLFSGGGAAYAKPFFTAYSASKTAVVRFAESLAEELREMNIQINVIAPGAVKSRMWDQMRTAGAAGGERLLEELKKMDETGGVPPDRAAALAVLLASNRSHGLSGKLISSVYDDWEHLPSRISEVMKSEAGTLRRIPLG